MIEKVVTKKKLTDKDNDVNYWLSRPVEERIAQLESIREEYIKWRYVDKPEFQKVVKIIRRKKI